LTGALLALNDEIRPNQLVFLSSEDVQSIVETRSMGVQGIALYNPLGGYADYLIPAVLMVILFQTLLMVISMRCGMECEQRNCSLYPFVDNRLWGRGAVSVVIGKALVYVSIYAVFSVFLLGFLPMLFGLPHLADAWLLVQLLVPYLFATSFFGLACSPFFKDSDAPLLLIAFFSVGLLFLSGISYPLELMPWPWRILHCLIPAPVGVLAFVKANSMGASLADIQGEWLLLWLQCVVYFCLACMAYRKTLSSHI
jgi:ABC-2 type transport system permease protein